jgi:hypothetical protein
MLFNYRKRVWKQRPQKNCAPYDQGFGEQAADKRGASTLAFPERRIERAKHHHI